MKKDEYIPYAVNDHDCCEQPLELGRISLNVRVLDHTNQEATVNLHINQPHHEEAYESVVATTKKQLPLELSFLELAKGAGLELHFEDLGWVTSYDPGYYVMLPIDPKWISNAKAFFADREKVRSVFVSSFKAVSVTIGCAGCHEPLEYLGGFGTFEDEKEKACTPFPAC